MDDFILLKWLFLVPTILYLSLHKTWLSNDSFFIYYLMVLFPACLSLSSNVVCSFSTLTGVILQYFLGAISAATSANGLKGSPILVGIQHSHVSHVLRLSCSKSSELNAENGTHHSPHQRYNLLFTAIWVGGNQFSLGL